MLMQPSPLAAGITRGTPVFSGVGAKFMLAGGTVDFLVVTATAADMEVVTKRMGLALDIGQCLYVVAHDRGAPPKVLPSEPVASVDDLF